jgi:Spy/CpxP family protein refolding chaperone
MKKLIVAALLVVGLTTYAQEKEGRRAGKEKLSSEQKVNLQVKKMTKDLDLNEKQTKDVRALVTKQVEKREDIKAQIQAEKEAVSVEMKKILTAEQYAKWEKNREEKIENFKEKMSKRKEKRKSQALPGK